MTKTITDKTAEKFIAEGRFKTIHIDTSLQVERCKEPRKKKVVEQALKDFGFTSTSTFAKFEFKCAWLRDLVYIYNASQNRKVNSLGELLAFVNDNLNAHPINRRRVTRCIDAIVNFLSRTPGVVPHGVDIIRFRSHISNAVMGAYSWWEHSVYHEYNGTGCIRACEAPVKLARDSIDMKISRCKPKNIKCNINKFFEEHKENFCAIKAEIEKLGTNASDELQKAKEIIDNAQKNPTYLCDDSICRALGDVLIAIDGIDADCFAANNDKEWSVLAQVLSKELLNPVREAKTTSKT